ncbi:MAG TPA: sulfotransferase [Gemmataceae bacterium]|jgi:hypothetical protein|nr:sulfotransferase [Gemmataceae bacterium]
MLENGGVEVVTDHVRAADTDNLRGYYEFEKMKRIKPDASWLPGTRGKAFKMVSQLLYDLPPDERYRIIFMERDLDEVLFSQEKMLRRLGRSAAPREEMRRFYTLHLKKLDEWLRHQRNIELLCVNYNDLVERPQGQAERVGAFLGGKANSVRMASTVDPSLYRHRKLLSDHLSDPVADTIA